MLNKSQSLRVYQELQESLDKLKKNLSNGDNNLEQISEIDAFSRLLLNFSTDEQIAIATEIHRELRLLKTDLIFLNTIKNPDKQTTRRQTIQNRLTRISSFCGLL